MEAGGVVAGTDVTLSREGRYGDGIFELRLWQVVTNPAIHITLNAQIMTYIITYFQLKC